MAGNADMAQILRGVAHDVAQAAEEAEQGVAKFIQETAGKVETAVGNTVKGDGAAADAYNSLGKTSAAGFKGKQAEIPAGVKRLPSGRLPPNYRWAGQVYNGEKWTPQLAAKYPNGVKFSPEGYPDFSPYATKTVTLENGFEGYPTDFNTANKLAGLDDTPDGYTWHHNEDGTTMQLVPSDMHSAVRHAGGMALTGGD
jgi:hypothetical protein